MPKASAPTKQPQTKTHNSFWERLQSRDKWPRCWWYPLRPQATQKRASKAIQKNYEECVATVRRTMLAILGFGLFAIVVTFGTPDSSLIAPEAKIPLPFANSKIAFLGFLIAAPALLVVLTTYLHIFDTSRRELENAYKISSVPALFTLDHRLPKLLTGIIFYWLVPIVLVALTWKALARLWWGLPLLAVTIAVAGGLVWMQIRRRPAHGRLRKNLPLWVLLILLTPVACFTAWEAFTGLAEPRVCNALAGPRVCNALAGFGEWHQDAFRRGLNLFRADLKDKWLAGADLRNADLRFASLVGANLSSARLQGADLEGAQLQGADLRELQGVKNFQSANLQDANLRGANLQDADLRRANLQGADLSGAKLQAARLTQAKLQRANLSDAQLQDADLTEAQLQRANLSEAKLQGADLQFAKLQGAVLRRANLQGADLQFAYLQGALLIRANLQGADLSVAKLQGADLWHAEIWLASFPTGLVSQSPTSLGTAKMSPLTADAKAKLRKRLQAAITDNEVLKSVMDRLDPILRDDPPEWDDEDQWRSYITEAKSPSTEELVAFLAGMACDDSEGHVASAMVQRAAVYISIQSRRDLGEVLAKALLNENCQGVKALTDEARATLENLVSASE